MSAPESIELAASITELLAREDFTDEEKAEFVARRIDSHVQTRRESIVRECSDIVRRMGNAANSAAQRAACLAASKALLDAERPKADRLQHITDTIVKAFELLLRTHQIDSEFAQKLATELVNEHSLIVQWVTRVGEFGMRIKANGVTVEVDAGPPPLDTD